jgi:flagellar hook assembly protein FlgD
VTKVSFAINKPGNASVRVFNTRGELVRTIVNQWFPQGQHEVSWDGKTASGGRAPSGIYFIKTDSNGGSDMIKAVMAK